MKLILFFTTCILLGLDQFFCENVHASSISSEAMPNHPFVIPTNFNSWILDLHKIRSMKFQLIELTTYPLSIPNDLLPSIGDPHRTPYLLHLTYTNYQDVPSKVWERLNKFAPEYDIRFYDDDACEAFIKKYFKPEIFDRYDAIVTCCHRADLFRYCLLYVYGGVYLDIKMQPEVPLHEIFDHQRRDVLYTVISSTQGNIFQGVLATYPRNPIFLELINHIIETDIDLINRYYTIITQDLFNRLTLLIGRDLVPGEHDLNPNLGSVILYLELNKQENDELPDRYNGFYGIYRNEVDPVRIFKTRYNDYPW